MMLFYAAQAKPDQFDWNEVEYRKLDYVVCVSRVDKENLFNLIFFSFHFFFFFE